MLTVAGKNSRKVLEIKEEVESTANKVLNDDNVVSEVIVENIVLERREEARELGISPGKLLLIEKLKEVDPKATTEEYKDKPVNEIVKTIRDIKKVPNENNRKDDDKKVNNEPNKPLPDRKADVETSAGVKENTAGPDAGIKPVNKTDNAKPNVGTDINNKENKQSAMRRLTAALTRATKTVNQQ